jgi:hypothetical protein
LLLITVLLLGNQLQVVKNLLLEPLLLDNQCEVAGRQGIEVEDAFTVAFLNNRLVGCLVSEGQGCARNDCRIRIRHNTLDGCPELGMSRHSQEDEQQKCRRPPGDSRGKGLRLHPHLVKMSF